MLYWRLSHQADVCTTVVSGRDRFSQANEAFFAKRWQEAERLYRKIRDDADQDVRHVARNMLGITCERRGQVDGAISLYEANLRERSPCEHSYYRLALLYRRTQQTDDMRRVLLLGTQVLASPARQWCSNRLLQRL
jgi:hypothetical protein